MIYSLISKGYGRSYTTLKEIFSSLDNAQKNYNWLITDCECATFDEDVLNKLYQNYCWLSGDELTEMVEKENFQWIWGVLSAFPKNISLEKVLEYRLPFANGNPDLWKNPVALQNPLAEIEIVPWDSTLVIFKSINEEYVKSFREVYPESLSLSEYNLT